MAYRGEGQYIRRARTPFVIAAILGLRSALRRFQPREATCIVRAVLDAGVLSSARAAVFSLDIPPPAVRQPTGRANHGAPPRPHGGCCCQTTSAKSTRRAYRNSAPSTDPISETFRGQSTRSPSRTRCDCAGSSRQDAAPRDCQTSRQPAAPTLLQNLWQQQTHRRTRRRHLRLTFSRLLGAPRCARVQNDMVRGV